MIDSNDSQPIAIKENYFLPAMSQVDLLNPPKSFPNPVSRYMLSDLTIVLDVYGGHDFGMLILSVIISRQNSLKW